MPKTSSTPTRISLRLYEKKSIEVQGGEWDRPAPKPATNTNPNHKDNHAENDDGGWHQTTKTRKSTGRFWNPPTPTGSPWSGPVPCGAGRDNNSSFVVVTKGEEKEADKAKEKGKEAEK